MTLNHLSKILLYIPWELKRKADSGNKLLKVYCLFKFQYGVFYLRRILLHQFFSISGLILAFLFLILFLFQNLLQS